RRGALGDRVPDLGLRVHPQPPGCAGDERRPAGEPGRLGVSLRPLPPRRRYLPAPVGLADVLSLRDRRVGRGRRLSLPPVLRVRLSGTADRRGRFDSPARRLDNGSRRRFPSAALAEGGTRVLLTRPVLPGLAVPDRGLLRAPSTRPDRGG